MPSIAILLRPRGAAILSMSTSTDDFAPTLLAFTGWEGGGDSSLGWVVRLGLDLGERTTE